MWCWHKWSEWKVIQQFFGEYVFGGGHALRTIQQRQCKKCKLVQTKKETT